MELEVYPFREGRQCSWRLNKGWKTVADGRISKSRHQEQTWKKKHQLQVFSFRHSGTSPSMHTHINTWPNKHAEWTTKEASYTDEKEAELQRCSRCSKNQQSLLAFQKKSRNKSVCQTMYSLPGVSSLLLEEGIRTLLPGVLFPHFWKSSCSPFLTHFKTPGQPHWSFLSN